MHRKLPEHIAAVDLGSNSFHLVLARVSAGEPLIIDRLREMIQLAAGVDASGELGAEAAERGIACCRRFGQRLRECGDVSIRAVGTNTFRTSRTGDFLARAEAALGAPIEIVSGNEEARLIYLGVAHTMGFGPGPRLVVDIGGGSTECIIGDRFQPVQMHSLRMGCVTYTQRFLPGGVADKKRMKEASLAAGLELETIKRRMCDIGWQAAVGSSGTVRTVAAAAGALGGEEGRLTAEGIERLSKSLVKAGDPAEIAKLPGIKEERAGVIAAGCAILQSVFEALEIESMDVAPGALREGLMYDLLGRIRHEDVRERTIGVFQARYAVDPAQATNVERTALRLLADVGAVWGLEDPDCQDYLAWAARVHEIGLLVSWGQHNRHGAYLLANADMPGFSRDEQVLLSTLVATHRRKVKIESFALLTRRWRDRAQRLAILLRLAVLLNRGRNPRSLPSMRIAAQADRLRIEFPSEWLERHPLTRLDFEEENERLKELGVVVEVC